jgi:hypothetical protein
VKLNQSFESLYSLDFLEYSLILGMLKKKIEESNSKAKDTETIYFDTSKPVNLKIPDNLKLK